ncbi:hypothetical protein JX266_013366 [Neoarthrinium moseri]|nr:hypothetical protein JX266_013366 [Neoarthrinium moseri]
MKFTRFIAGCLPALAFTALSHEAATAASLILNLLENIATSNSPTEPFEDHGQDHGQDRQALDILRIAKFRGKARECTEITDGEFLVRLSQHLAFVQRPEEPRHEALLRLVEYQAVGQTMSEIVPIDVGTRDQGLGVCM